MSSTNALEMIEIRNLVGIVEVTNATAKAVNITLIGKEQVGGGLVTAMVHGDVGTVKTATDTGAAATEHANELLSAYVTPRPHTEVDIILPRTAAELWF